MRLDFTIVRLTLAVILFDFIVCNEVNNALVVHGRNSSRHFSSPPFVRFKMPFHITAPLVTLSVGDDCHDTEALRGKILVIQRDSLEELCGFSARDPHEFARSHGCVGLIRILKVKPHLIDYTAYKITPIPTSRFHDQVPAVALLRADGIAILGLMNSDEGPFNATISSDRPNSVVELFTNPWIILMFSLSGIQSAYNLLEAIGKIYSFLFRGEHRLPLTPFLILVPEVLANLARLALSVNTAIFAEAGLGWPIYRIMFTISVPLGFISTLAISYRLYKTYRQSFGMSEESKLTVFLVRGFAFVTFTVVLFDISFTIFVAIFGEWFNVTLISLFYAIVQVPLVYFFLATGTRTAKRLLENIDAVDSNSLRQRLRFVRRVRLGGFAIILNMANMAAFSLFGEQSFALWYLLFATLLHTFGWVSTFQIAAMRPPDPMSMFSRRANGRCRKQMETILPLNTL